MGCCVSHQFDKSQAREKSSSKIRAMAIADKFANKSDLNRALRENGLEQSNLLVAIDFTKSNLWQGDKTFNRQSLHTVDFPPPAYDENANTSLEFKRCNPYQYVLNTIGAQLDEFDDDGYIPTCIFGHSRGEHDPYVKELHKGPGCLKMAGVLQAYESAIRSNGLSGGTRFAPVIRWAADIVRRTRSYTILLIVGDGCIDDLVDTRKELADASRLPMSVIFVGVGDGSNPNDPHDKWSSMRVLDDSPTGLVDNWQSVYLVNLMDELRASQHPDLLLATHMLMEIPDQYKYFKAKGMI